MFNLLDISATGLSAQRVRMDITANNLVNQGATKKIMSPDGKLEPYRRRFAVLMPGAPGDPTKPGVHVSKIERDMSPFTQRNEPGNPDADADGNVLYPNVDMTFEMVNMIDASRAYEANITAMETTKSMLNATLRLLA
jgi:flagellar basal-body rod protein FlgC